MKQICTCNDPKMSAFLIEILERDEIKYRAMGWFHISDLCREMVHQIELGNYGHLCDYKGLTSCIL